MSMNVPNSVKSVKGLEIVFVGAGRVATSLALALHSAGHTILQVYSRTEKSAQSLAEKVDSAFTTSLESLSPRADLYIVALTDTALAHLAPHITQGREDSLFVHTAGSMSIDTLTCPRRGVFYPMQTFSMERVVDFRHVPCFVEASTETDVQLLQTVASGISDNVFTLSSADRQYLHLAAVFCCNFSNHCYAIAERMLAEHGVPFSVMLPLIDETAAKVHNLSPVLGQTGPAARGDKGVMDRQERLLTSTPLHQQIYRLMSEDIQRFGARLSSSSSLSVSSEHSPSSDKS